MSPLPMCYPCSDSLYKNESAVFRPYLLVDPSQEANLEDESRLEPMSFFNSHQDVYIVEYLFII